MVFVDRRLADPLLQAIAVLRRDHRDIFSRLQVRVSRLKIWTMQDVTHNMAGGRLYLPNNERPVEHPEIEASLTQRRTYKVSTSITASTSLR